MQRRVKPVSGRRIEKPEDKVWKEWYDKLDPKEHEEYLSKLGLDKEDIEEWEESGGLKGAAECPEETEEVPVEKKAFGAAKAKKKK